MSEHTTSRYQRRQEAVEPKPQDNTSFWDKLKSDKSYTGHKYNTEIFLDDDLTESELERNSSWLHASKVVYNMEYGKGAWAKKVDEEGWSDEEAKTELAEYGLSYMGWFNYNIVNMGLQAAQIESDETKMPQKIAFKYLMDAYDHKSMSWSGWGRAGLGMITDPTMLVGGGTLAYMTKKGIGFGISKSLSHSLQKTLIGTTVMGVEGAIYGYKDNENRQQVDIVVGAQDGWDYKQSATAAGIGFVAGKALGVAVPYVAKNAGKWASNTKEFAGTTAGKVTAASTIIGTPAAVIAHSNYQEHQEQEQVENASDAFKKALEDGYSKGMQEKLSMNDDASENNGATPNISGIFTNLSLHNAHNDGAFSPETSTGLNPLAVAFHNQAYGLNTRIDPSTLGIASANDPSFKIEANLQS